MPAIDKIDMSGTVVGERQVSDGLIEEKVNTGLLHEVIRAEEAAARSGTAAAKSRGMVKASGAKPWRQKGVGRARAGSASMPQWTGGGVVFPPMPRDFSFKVNKRVQVKAYRQALGNLVLNDKASVLAQGFDEPSTKKAVAILEGSGVRDAAPGCCHLRGGERDQILQEYSGCACHPSISCGGPGLCLGPECGSH